MEESQWKLKTAKQVVAERGKRVERFYYARPAMLIAFLDWHGKSERTDIADIAFEHDPGMNSTNVDQPIKGIRDRLGEESIIKDNGFQLNGNITSDVGEFKRAINIVKQMDGDGLVDHLKKALEEYNGEFLAAYGKDAPKWIHKARGEIATLRMKGLRLLIDALVSLGKREEAIKWSKRADEYIRACIREIKEDRISETACEFYKAEVLDELYCEFMSVCLKQRNAEKVEGYYQSLERLLHEHFAKKPSERAKDLLQEAKKLPAEIRQSLAPPRPSMTRRPILPQDLSASEQSSPGLADPSPIHPINASDADIDTSCENPGASPSTADTASAASVAAPEAIKDGSSASYKQTIIIAPTQSSKSSRTQRKHYVIPLVAVFMGFAAFFIWRPVSTQAHRIEPPLANEPTGHTDSELQALEQSVHVERKRGRSTQLASSLEHLAKYYRGRGMPSDEARALESAIDVREAIAPMSPDLANAYEKCAACYRELGANYMDREGELWQKAVVIRRQYQKQMPKELAYALEHQAAYFRDRGNFALEAQALEEAIRIRQNCTPESEELASDHGLLAAARAQMVSQEKN